MTMPVDENRQQNAEMLGRVSSAIIEDETFLEAIKEGNEEEIQKKLQKILKGYFAEQLNDL